MHRWDMLVSACGQASPDIHTFIDRSNTIMESGDDRGHSQKQRKLGQDQNVTPSDTDSQIEQGPPKKRKLAQEQDLPTVDIDSRRVSSCLKRQRLPNKRDSTTPTAIHLSQGLPNKQQLAQDQSITPPDTDSSEQESRCSAPDTRHRRAKWSLERHARSMEECCQDFFTLARVNITAALPAAKSRSLLQSDSEHIYRKGVPVLLKHYSTSMDGQFSCRVRSLGCEDVFEFEGLADRPQGTAEILRQVIKVAVAREESKYATICWLSKISYPAEGAIEERWKLCCKLLAKNAMSLSDYLPIKSNDLFDIYAPGEPYNTFDAWSPRDFYDNVCVPDKVGIPTEDTSLDPLNGDLKCQLYPFQKRAVKWLLHREGPDAAGGQAMNQKQQDTQQKLPQGFVRTTDVDGKEWMVSRCLSIATKDERLVQGYASQIKGGILSEEMGLGKTVEMIALICLHRRSQSMSQPMPEESLVQSPATLIITPLAILRQWESELRTLAPHLKVFIYQGVRNERKILDNDQLVARLAQQDVVLTTYNVLGREVHYTTRANPPRDMRYQKVYEQRESPLTQIMWWRVVLDEAQMVESGVSNAAKVAQVIPREHAWAVSGTPVKKDSQDLLGLLIFLRFEPYCHSVKLWNRMIQNHRDVFHAIFRTIALRHTKDQIKDELQLPSQTRVIINVPFTQIEEQHYSTMYQEMCRDCGLDLNGSPLSEDWDPSTPAIVEKMRTWLARLRQTCLHPEVGSRNRRALGASKGPLRTVDEVLDVMTEQNETASRIEERTLLLSRIRRGQVLEHANQSYCALRLWKEVLEEARLIVEIDRQQLKSETNALGLADKSIDFQDSAAIENMTTSRVGVYRHRLRSALEIEHICTFFVANAYFQIKSNTDHVEPESAAYKELEKAEESNYELAKALRQEMLAESFRKADAYMKRIRAKVFNRDIVQVPSIKEIKDQGGIESRDLLARTQNLFRAINEQARQLAEWRQKQIDLVLLPLVDKEESDVQGDEYEISTKQQDEVYVHMDALRAIVSDRHDFMTGQTNLRIDNEMKAAVRQADNGEGHSPELMKKLLHIRAHLKPGPHVGSVRGVITELRELKTTLRAQLDRGSVRAGAELLLVDTILETVQAVSSEQSKVLTGLGRELELFKETVDSRLEYYRQLQHISDTVAPYEEDMDESTLARTIATMEDTEARIRDRLATLKSRGRYLVHLKTEATSLDTQRQCIICREQFERGVLTSCGHSYCVDCARLWWNAHRNCPTCKKSLSKNDFHQITYKPRELTMHEAVALTGKAAVANGDSGTIYSGVTKATLNQIEGIDLDGSFGTKIDTLARHIMWIRENDPGAKAVIFSQFKDFLDVLGKAFRQFGIAFTSFDNKHGVRDFKDDPSIECFFLHAKAQSSGLNLVNATHVFLCEPLINTAIELQAIARVHRIGQHHPTTVWMYLVEDTVEKSIYEISVNRRMSHISPAAARGSAWLNQSDATESRLDAANTLELQQAALSRLLTKGPGGGEMVGQEDLWNCLFRQKPEQIRQIAAQADREAALRLRVSAAERRQEGRQDVAMGGMA